MLCRNWPVQVLLAWASLQLAGCATTPTEPPPAVAPQPPDVLASDVIAEQEVINALEDAGVDPGAVLSPAPAAPSARTTPPAASPPRPSSGSAQATRVPVIEPASTSASTRGQRFRPTEQSIQQIRERNAAAPRELDFRQRLDGFHDDVYVWTQGMVEKTDRRFIDEGDPPKPVPAAPFRIGMVGEWVQREDGPDLALDSTFDIALRLPNLEERLRIFVSSGNLDESPRDRRETEGLRAGLRYELLRYFDFDVGIRLDIPPVLFSSIKWSREFALGSWDFYPFAKLFAETKESVGWAGAVTFDRWSGRNLLRTSTNAKWRADTTRTQWSETVIVARANELIVPDRYGSFPLANDIGRGWGVRLLAGGDTSKTVDRYESGVFYRQRTPIQWLYWSVEPIVRWDRKYDWNADPGIRIGFEALFWDLARAGR